MLGLSDNLTKLLQCLFGGTWSRKSRQLTVSHLTKYYLQPSARAGPQFMRQASGRAVLYLTPDSPCTGRGLSRVSLCLGEQSMHLRDPSVETQCLQLLCTLSVSHNCVCKVHLNVTALNNIYGCWDSMRVHKAIASFDVIEKGDE